ncbi:tRNA pseudouridine(38-40) synthase TruA [Solemya pervernicosa gill symbiont]|uniref:tRNA pseudouridine synthase A n=2 Tax=Gammaproteobacteria incertae sedis TaxID=118884 RepID=A0A1T2L6T3_9GAMM|nr:tRNA pseudouridine(38-40) synthase TruA [Candidatus Reidiella endopervernicosa]OOZ40818.1 tRNA pseudouridine(38-40) synthase TruA [Solemya pervernicosa gill symbiont]QKQ26329.1 tRNA pseudouridine(38-40) synthase TruA [Candidatus Reidiella endopervernicosa]
MKIALGIEYNGSSFHGWQRQRSVPSVQESIEAALTKVANHPIVVVCAGRTDAEVHATGQVIHFESDAERRERAWMLGSNANLPDGVSVTWAQRVSDDFHARFSATGRRYRYVILNRDSRPGVMSGRVSWIYAPLDANRMHRAAQALLGECDFTSFRAQGCQSNTPWRRLDEIKVTRSGDFVVIEVEANAFLHHMVRNIAGVLIAIGSGDQSVEWAAEVLALRDRTQAGVTAPPHGLYLVKVRYPEQFAIPDSGSGPLLL